MLVVLDGPEKAGKTTLARKIMEWVMENRKTNIHYRRHIHGDSNHETIMNDLEFALSHPEDLIIYDRWWSSELVYRPFDGKPPNLPLRVSVLEGRYGGLADSAGMRIMVVPAESVLQERRDYAQDSTDIPIPVHRERDAFYEVARRGNWIATSVGWDVTLQEAIAFRWDRLLEEQERFPMIRKQNYWWR